MNPVEAASAYCEDLTTTTGSADGLKEGDPFESDQVCYNGLPTTDQVDEEASCEQAVPNEAAQQAQESQLDESCPSDSTHEMQNSTNQIKEHASVNREPGENQEKGTSPQPLDSDDVSEYYDQTQLEMHEWTARGQQLAMECTELLKSIVQFRLHKRQVLEEAAQPYQEEKRKLLAREAALNIKAELVRIQGAKLIDKYQDT